ncbi:hypothetical protein [Nocardia gamkensis]|uniref:hypothetical protein n=1 Tax=Nocardia gamkensis TaxID=352869 RepID=UPI0037C5BC5A
MSTELSQQESTTEQSPEAKSKYRLRSLMHVRPGKFVVVSALLATFAVVFAVLSVVALRDHQIAEHQRSTDAEILDAARSGVLAMVSIRDTSAPDDIAKVLEQSTGPFHKDFESRARSFISVVQEAKVVTTGDVIAQGIESRNGDSAEVLVYATSKVSNAAGAQNESRTWRLRVTMSDDGGRYKMSNVEFVA